MLAKHNKASAPSPSSVRIISGDLRGSRLPVPALPGLRPTPDRVRETLFNWLRPTLPGTRVLDLFAGSGALGVEALSLGAREVDFVEADGAAAQSLREQLQRLRVQDRAKVRCGRAPAVLQMLQGPYQLILLDPPYAADLWTSCLAAIDRHRLLHPDGLIYVEWPYPGPEPVPAGWSWHRRTRASAVNFGLLQAVVTSANGAEPTPVEPVSR